MFPFRVPGSSWASAASTVLGRAKEVEFSSPPAFLVVSSRWSTVALLLPLLLTSGWKPKVPSGFSIIMLLAQLEQSQVQLPESTRMNLDSLPLSI